MDLENTVIWGNTGAQWLQVGGWIFGFLLVGLLIYWLIEFFIEPLLRHRSRLSQALSDLVQQGILIGCLIFGLQQAFDSLNSSFIVLTLEELFIPIAFGLTLLWFALRLYKWATPDNEVKDAILSQLVPLAGVLVALLWIGRFWITRPLTCVPNCTGQSALNADLSGLGLGAVNLVNANLRGADLSDTNLVGADLSSANLTTAVLRNADLSEAVLIGADLTGADLRGAILEDTNFSGAILSQANLTQADLTRTNLSGATLIETTLIETTLANVHLAGITLTGANLTGADLTHTNLHGAYLSGADLSDVTLTEAELTGALVNTSNLTGVNLTQANLAGASFIGANLTSANLSHSKLVGATLIGTNLKGADLRTADLTGTRMLESEILPSDIGIDAILFQLNELQLEQLISDANLNGVNFNQTTVWPEGKDAFLSRLLGDLADTAETDETITPEAEAVEPDFVIIGQPSSQTLNQAILTKASETAVSTVVNFATIDPTLAFGLLCTDETIAMLVTNQPIGETEQNACEASEQFPLEILIATEAFVLVAHPQNEFVETLTPAQTRTLLTAERWTDVDTRWPSEPLLRFLPALETAELNLFQQWVDSEGETDLTDAPNTTFSSDPLERITLLADEVNGIAVVDYGTYLQNSDSLRLLEIEEVVLSADKVAAGEYLFVQPLYLYLDRNDVVDNQQVADFLSFYLDNIGETVESAGYFPIDAQLLANIQAAIGQAQAGELLLGNAIIETAAIAPEAPVITDTVPITPTQTITLPQTTAATPLTTIVAVGDQAVTLPLLAAYSRSVTAQTDLSLMVTPLPQAASWQALCVGQTADLVMTTASPPVDMCDAAELVAIPTGLDGIAIVVHPENSFATSLTRNEIIALLFAETWSEVNTAWPDDQQLTKFSADRALTEQLITLLVQDDPNLALSLRTVNFQIESDVAQLVDRILTNPNSFGVASFAAIRPFAAPLTTNGVQFVAITDQGIVDQAIANETIENGRYPFTRSLLLYTTTHALQTKPILRPFLTAYLAQIPQITSSLGYIPPATDQIQRAQARLDTIPPATIGNK